MNDRSSVAIRFEQLLSIMSQLRGPEGCPWDREQNHRSLISCLVEECAELSEALQGGTDNELIEELGDVLLQVVFHSEIAKEEERFDIEDVLTALIEKLISRHPHVFGAGRQLNSSGEVVHQWEEIKKGEKEKRQRKSLMDGIPIQLPALQYAAKVQSRAAKVGFDWPDHRGVEEKLVEELNEVKEAFLEKEKLSCEATEEEKERVELRLEEEMGDLFFTVVNFSRHLGVPPEQALQIANRKFSNRFRMMESMEPQLSQRSMDELEELWQKAKAISASHPSV